jgi:hypothetical protein
MEALSVRLEAKKVEEMKVGMATTAMSPVVYAHQENISAIS